MTQNSSDHRLTRRTILGGTAALATYAAWSRRVLGADDPKPNSVINGVRIGCITYSYRGGADTAEDTLDCLHRAQRPESALFADRSLAWQEFGPAALTQNAVPTNAGCESPLFSAANASAEQTAARN